MQGRFTSPDVPFAGQDESDPQTCNLYAYTSNNPLNRIDPDGRRWFYKKNGNEIGDIQWVNPNDDGSYTSPGEGYTAFVPTAANPSLMIFVDGGNAAVFFGENKDGSPYQSRAIATGRVVDASWEFAGLFIPARLSLKGIAAGTSALWAKYAARKGLQEVGEHGAVELGSKLDYILGKATGNAHNVERSAGMLRELERIGLPDSAATRELLTNHLTRIANQPGSIIQANGRVVKESLLMGPGGQAVKLQTIWEGKKLITATVKTGKR
ncbi:MAG: hypothetical protein KIT57_24580 [Blastocatellales bacterium]|nr:hypothetical protein [Blastocatellales bacterium]